MLSFPISLQIAGRRAVVIGGGNVAQRKIFSLLAAGACVRVIAPEISEGIRVLEAAAPLECIERGFTPSDLGDAFIVITATDDEHTNAAVMNAARKAGILSSDATVAQRGDFTMPACHRIGSLTFTVDTNGRAPAFAKRLRDELALRFGDEYAAAADTVAAAREYLNASVPIQYRAAVLRQVANLPLPALAAMNRSQIEREVRALLARKHGDELRA